MFPLEHAVLPTAIIPLHIFEPRYRSLAADVTVRPEPEFGIAPIERGREVGGDDVRAEVAVVARVLEFEELPDGRWAVISIATRRIRVLDRLDDDPYPRHPAKLRAVAFETDPIVTCVEGFVYFFGDSTYVSIKPTSDENVDRLELTVPRANRPSKFRSHQP